MIKRVLLLIILLGLLPGIAFSQETLINISCEKAELKDVINTISSIAGVDIIYGNEVMGKMVTIKLREIPWEKALKIVLDLSGFSYEWEENLIRVKEKTKAVKAVAEEKVVTQIYILKNIKAEEIAGSPSLKELLTERGKIVVDKGLNALSITDTESNVGRIVAFIKRLDEGEKVTKIISLNFAKAADVVSSGILSQLLSEEGEIKTDARTNSLVVTDSKTNIKEIEEFIKKIDLPTPQVMIEATILETNYDYLKDIGITWDISKKLETTYGKKDYGIGITLPAGGSIGTFSIGYLTQEDFHIVLTALEQKTETTILSNPRIAVLDNQSATILVGKKVPIQTQTVTGGTVTVTTEFIDTGVKLSVTPRITPDGHITLKIHPEVSDIYGYTAKNDPIIATAEADTTVLVKSGQTVVIGGLLKERRPETITKVPFLGDIPILGWLFKKKTIGTVEKRELIIFITPRVITQLEKPPEKITKSK